MASGEVLQLERPDNEAGELRMQSEVSLITNDHDGEGFSFEGSSHHQ